MTPEYDLILMTLVIFLPTLFAIPLMIPYIFPKGSEEYMRWWALLATAVTLALNMWIFIDYRQDVYVLHEMGNQSPESGSLVARAAADTDTAGGAINVRRDHDWFSSLPWIRNFHINYTLGLDGISLPLILLTTGLSFLAIIASWKIEKYVRGYLILFLLLETGMVGTFLALDFFLFYIFWEVMLLPMYFLIGVWGGPRREYAAIKFFLYTLFGSVLILIALLGFYFTNLAPLEDYLAHQKTQVAQELTDVDRQMVQAERSEADALKQKKSQLQAALTLRENELRFVHREANAGGTYGKINTFSLPLLHIAGRESEAIVAWREDEYRKALDAFNKGDAAKTSELNQNLKKADDNRSKILFTKPFQITMFVLLLIGFAIKVPVFPFHTWLPDAHVEAPTPISMILAGVLLKMGGYGIIRIAYPICPNAAQTLAWYIAIFAMINIIYGAFAAMAQTDFKKLVAYSSVSHMGYVLLGIAVWAAPGMSQYWSWGMNGAMFQMIAHGITSAGMFFLVGVIYDRAHHRNLENFRGLNEPMPFYGGISAIIFFAAMGLPGMCGFVGEFMVVLSTWNYSPTLSILAALTVVLTAAYILWTLQRVFFGTNPAYKNYQDITLREVVCITPLLVFSVLLGVLPGLLLDWMEPSVSGLVRTLANIKY